MSVVECHWALLSAVGCYGVLREPTAEEAQETGPRPYRVDDGLRLILSRGHQSAPKCTEVHQCRLEHSGSHVRQNQNLLFQVEPVIVLVTLKRIRIL